jgi:hypothetical protein
MYTAQLINVQSSVLRKIAFVSTFLLMLLGFMAMPHHAAAAACTAPSTDYGTVTLTATVPATATYRVWTRMAAASSTTNTYMLEVDGSSCYNVGGTGVPVYASGATKHFATDSSNWVAKTKAGSFIDASLTSGSHSLKLIGNADGVVLDRLVLTGDTTCTPTGTGDNCANPADTTDPVVTITRPADNTTLTSTVQVAAQATDDVGVAKVEFYVDNVLKGTASTANQWGNYNFDLDPTAYSDGAHVLTAKAYDAALNSATSSPINFTVDTNTPPAPTIAGDINGDGKVDFLDFSSLAGKYGQTGSNLGSADINGDGKVDFLDFSILASHYGE